MKKRQQKNQPLKGDKTSRKPAGNKKEDEAILFDLPEARDIPGQEHIRPPHIREMMDTTASSADEEGEGLLDDVNTKEKDRPELITSAGNLSEQEKKLLRKAGRPVSEEEKDRLKLSLNSTDDEARLNESADIRDMGEDLDADTESDEGNKDIGEEDEENDIYSRPD